MLFNSVSFLIFFVVVVTAHFALPHAKRWMLLLGASYFFYMCWRPEYVVLLIAATLVNYGIGIALGRTAGALARRLLLLTSLSVSLGILFTYKYLDFFAENMNELFAAMGVARELPAFDLILPLGISFYTFQSIGYAIDVYRRTTPIETHLGIFALYVSFFPQLVAGPIERSQHLLPQFRFEHRLERQRAVEGLRLMLWGMFKKVVIADRVAVVVDTVYAAPDQFAGPFLLLASVFFAVQIYCDFSGYSDIAIGAARLMGYDLMTNFRRPYFATSVAEFWRRWHISLSTWFRDYVYKPLGGNRVSTLLWGRNILVVFTVSGLWHGANWTFLAWGALHGVYLVLEAATRGPGLAVLSRLGVTRFPRALRFAQILFVDFLMVIGWVFFRAQSIDEAFDILARSFDFRGFDLNVLWVLGLPRFEMMIAFASIVALFSVDAVLEYRPARVLAVFEKRPLRWGLYFAALYSLVFFGSFGGVEFIYFQF